MDKYKSRCDVPDKYKWDLTDYFADDKDFNKSFTSASSLVDELPSYVGCTKDAGKLYEFLNKDILTMSLVERLYIYAYLINDQELGNSINMERKSKCEKLLNKYTVNTSFFNSELLHLSTSEYDKLFIDNKSLNEYKFGLDEIYRKKEHILSEDKEVIIANLNEAMNHFEDMSSTMLNSEHKYGEVEINGEKEAITTTNLRRLLKNDDRNLRKTVRDKFNSTLGNYLVSSAQFLNGYVNANNCNSKVHNYRDAWDEHVDDLHLNDKIYDTLVKNVEDNVSSLQRYFKVFKSRLGVDELHQYDLNMDMAKCNHEYSIEDAQELCLNAIKPLGEDYVNHFKKVFDNHYIDYAQYPSKCSGGYSFAPLDRNSRILMSYNYDLDSVSTIIHEGGHNVHHQYISEHNKIQDVEVSSLVSEVASLTNECLLSNYLANNGSSKEEKLAGISNILNVIVSNLYGAVREGKMEREFNNLVVEGNSITKDYMNKLTYDSLVKYYGDSVVLDDYSGYSWALRSHYYMDYYLFNYSFCISVACNVAREIINGNKDMLNRYLRFLSTGGNTLPLDAFKILGVDLSDDSVYINAIKYFNEMLDKFIEIGGDLNGK